MTAATTRIDLSTIFNLPPTRQPAKPDAGRDDEPRPLVTWWSQQGDFERRNAPDAYLEALASKSPERACELYPVQRRFSAGRGGMAVEVSAHHGDGGVHLLVDITDEGWALQRFFVAAGDTAAFTVSLLPRLLEMVEAATRLDNAAARALFPGKPLVLRGGEGALARGMRRGG